ncbi:hypothetical protein EDD16DRAFT_1519391 [Pisolithus croceorrhizus]|nr:hypothetical protein EDD16DRAFT_1519391 [Pisolithus croceorrhizus]
MSGIDEKLDHLFSPSSALFPAAALGSPAFRYLSIVGVANAPTPPAQSRHPESSIPTRYVNHRATAFTLKEELISFTLPKTDLLTKYNFAASADELPSTPKPVFVAELRSHATYTHICTHRLHPVPLAPKEAKERDTSPSSPLIECRSAADSPEQHNADRRHFKVIMAEACQDAMHIQRVWLINVALEALKFDLEAHMLTARTNIASDAPVIGTATVMSNGFIRFDRSPFTPDLGVASDPIRRSKMEALPEDTEGSGIKGLNAKDSGLNDPRSLPTSRAEL